MGVGLVGGAVVVDMSSPRLTVSLLCAFEKVGYGIEDLESEPGVDAVLASSGTTLIILLVISESVSLSLRRREGALTYSPVSGSKTRGRCLRGRFGSLSDFSRLLRSLGFSSIAPSCFVSCLIEDMAVAAIVSAEVFATPCLRMRTDGVNEAMILSG